VIQRDAIEPEDVQREPDGIPHAVIGLTVLFAAVFAVMMLWMDTASGRVGAVIVALVALPIIVLRLQRMAERDRDHRHPSR
jgi:ABC-type phosphate transport system permease subunit